MKTEPHTALLTVIGVDIGKEVFHLVGLSADGEIAFRRKIRRLGLKDAFEQLPACIVGMEACLSAHFVSRVLRGLDAPRIWCPNRLLANLSENEINGACVLPSWPRPASRSTGRIQISDFRPSHLTCDGQPIHTIGANSVEPVRSD